MTHLFYIGDFNKYLLIEFKCQLIPIGLLIDKENILRRHYKQIKLLLMNSFSPIE